ncbi:MAG: carboxypeptidase regulatory-like domain-containing protein [Acidobacteriaceae bacterium]|nr:carboxypeptidase regulatory-like domain-containing protein [Acidobacteriaceae bacterium]
MKLRAYRFHAFAALVIGLSLSAAPLMGQTPNDAAAAVIVGTVTAVTGDTVPEATVGLEGPDQQDRRAVNANDDGYFEFHDVKPGVPYQVKINAEGFSVWTSPVITLDPNQFKILTDIHLRVQLAPTTVNVSQTADEVATEQIQVEEKQRVLGIIPNFYVVYDSDPEPLDTKLKFRLALKVATDPIIGLGVAFLSGVQQAGDSLNYGQGAAGYGKRFGANAADGFSDIMIGGAILPSLLHQEPRYFYQGTGTRRSRFIHAFVHPFVCLGDNRKWQPNYSSLGGDLASSSLSNLYYPESNRGARLVFTDFGVSTAERIATSLAQEFVLRRIQFHTNR